MNVKRLFKAITFAADKHRGQTRKDDDATPYINHPIAVATVLAVEGDVDDESLLMAAILHDTVEDTETSPDELVACFGGDVGGLVAEVTDDKSLPKMRRKQLQIEHASHASDRAKQLKLADKICNIRDLAQNPPKGWSAQRKLDYLDWADRVIAGCRGTNPQLEAAFDVAVAQARAERETP